MPTPDLELRQALYRLDRHGDEYLLLVWPEGQPDQARVFVNGCTYNSYFTLRELSADLLSLFLRSVAEQIKAQTGARP